MKLNTIRDYPLTADFYRITSATADDVPIYSYIGSGPCDMSTNGGMLYSISTPVRLLVMDRVMSITDANGVLVIDEEYEVKKRIPLINSYGFSEGVLYTVASAPPAIIEGVPSP